MNITYTQNIEECTFQEIEYGECFEVEGLIHLKINNKEKIFVDHE